jgi:SAM-dependent MidA family methyltransferase
MPTQTWRAAMDQALYGPAGFYRAAEGPAGHFRTAANDRGSGPPFAAAIRRLADAVDEALGRQDPFHVVDVGAGRGELVSALAAGGMPSRWRLVGVDIVPRPAGLPADVEWSAAVPSTIDGLVLANEWLDTVPLNTVVLTDDGPRVVHVAPDGCEVPGGPAAQDEQRWLDRWWPLRSVGDRAEIGLTRDQAWAGALGSVRRGVAVGIDYGHVRTDRPPGGTRVGYRTGRVVAPTPDGRRDVTAHVAMDSCAAAGRRAGAAATLSMTQREGLRRLGVTGR